MARTPRIDVAGVAQRVIQRGVNRSVCFCDDLDHEFYLASLQEASVTHACAIHAYVLMTNHVHLLVTGKETGCVSAMMQSLGSDSQKRLLIYQALLDESICQEEIRSIRDHTNQGKVLGSTKFQKQIEELTGRSVCLKPMGRPRNRKVLPKREKS